MAEAPRPIKTLEDIAAMHNPPATPSEIPDGPPTFSAPLPPESEAILEVSRSLEIPPGTLVTVIKRSRLPRNGHGGYETTVDMAWSSDPYIWGPRRAYHYDKHYYASTGPNVTGTIVGGANPDPSPKDEQIESVIPFPRGDGILVGGRQFEASGGHFPEVNDPEAEYQAVLVGEAALNSWLAVSGSPSAVIKRNVVAMISRELDRLQPDPKTTEHYSTLEDWVKGSSELSCLYINEFLRREGDLDTLPDVYRRMAEIIDWLAKSPQGSPLAIVESDSKSADSSRITMATLYGRGVYVDNGQYFATASRQISALVGAAKWRTSIEQEDEFELPEDDKDLETTVDFSLSTLNDEPRLYFGDVTLDSSGGRDPQGKTLTAPYRDVLLGREQIEGWADGGTTVHVAVKKRAVAAMFNALDIESPFETVSN